MAADPTTEEAVADDEGVAEDSADNNVDAASTEAPFDESGLSLPYSSQARSHGARPTRSAAAARQAIANDMAHGSPERSAKRAAA